MIRVITLFSGYDSQCLALKRLGVEYELVAWCEIDKAACKAHDALFPQWRGRNVGDISKVDWEAWREEHEGEVDLLTYSSPCQDFSQAGLQRGGEEGSGTRSGLLWEVERAIAAIRPKALVFENVAGLVGKKHVGLFNKWQARLNGYGYTNFEQLMNSKDYGVPQNRLRIFMVSILDCKRAFYFPRPIPLERRLKDVLEQDVPERYYLSDERVIGLLKSTEKEGNRGNGFAFKPKTAVDEYAGTIQTTAGRRKTDNFIVEPQVIGWSRDKQGNVTNRHAVEVANCVTAAKRDNTQNYVQTIISPAHGYFKGAERSSVDPTCKASGMREQHFVKEVMEWCPAVLTMRRTEQGKEERRQHKDDKGVPFRGGKEMVPRRDGVSNTVTTVGSDNMLVELTRTILIRRLTERELFRLMDVDEADIDVLLGAGISSTQLAKLVGNSIVVACLEGIFRNLLIETEAMAGVQTKLF